MFGVKEGEEFYIDSHGVKYKIENNNLMVDSFGWNKSENGISWLSQEHEIEILKPKMPVEIAKILETIKLDYVYD